MEKYLSVSIILPTYNGANTLPGLLESLQRQTYPVLELIVVDSSSSDGSIEILKKYAREGLQLRLKQIDLVEFSHSHTRNLAAGLAKGEILVFLVQDAKPADVNWLGNLVSPFKDSDVACAFSRQEARANANPLIKGDIERCFNSFKSPGLFVTRQNRFEKPDDYAKRPEWFWFNSDVSSAVRSSVFNKIQFKPVPYAEDQILGKDLIEAGYTKIYVDNSIVIHSHQYSLIQQFKRQFDENRGLRLSTKKFTHVRVYDFIPRIIWRCVCDVRYLKKTQEKNILYWSFYAIIYNTLRVAGMWCGQYFFALPPIMQVCLSLEHKAYSRNGAIISIKKSV